MRITITGFASPEPSSAVTFRSACGEGQGLWWGEIPKSNCEYDVELSMRGRVTVRQCASPLVKNHAAIAMTTEGVSITGVVEDVLEGDGFALRMQDSVVMVDHEADVVTKGDIVEVLADGLDIYDVRT